MPTARASKYWERWLLTGVIVSALFFRLYKLEKLMVFSGETNNLFYYIEAYLAGEKPWLLGLEAAQYVHHLFHLPWYLWMMIPVYFVGGGNPLVFAVLQATIGALGAYLIWKIGLMLESERVGRLAALGYAASFHLAVVERFVSPVSWVPLGTIVTIFLGVLAFKKKTGLWFLGLGFWAGASVSFHWASLLTLLVVMLWIGWRQAGFWRWAVAGMAMAFLPMIIFDLRHGFFNLTGLWFVGKSLFDGSRPYGSSQFVYQLYPVLILVSARLISLFPKKAILFLVIVFFVSQLVMLKNYEIHPNFADRKRVVDDILDRWSNGLGVYFKDESSFDFGYLLRWEARNRGFDPGRIVIYEPWQPENQANIVVETSL